MVLIACLAAAAAGISSLIGGGITARYWNTSEAPLNPTDYSWQKASFYEEEPATELMEDIWERVDKLALRWPGYTAERYKKVAMLEQEMEMLQGAWAPPSALIESSLPGLVKARSELMAAGASALAMDDGVVQRKSAPCSSRKGRRLATTFLRYWVAAVKQQFEMRQDRPADRAAMRTWLGKELRQHGLRVTHVSRVVPLITRLALLPDEADRVAVASADAIRMRTRWGRLRYNYNCWWQRTMAPPADAGYTQ